jgi:hypothetical protein
MIPAAALAVLAVNPAGLAFQWRSGRDVLLLSGSVFPQLLFWPRRSP